jgi:hypothetical protein
MRKGAAASALLLLLSIPAWSQQSSLAGSWRATFADSVSNGISLLILDVQSDGTVSGVLRIEGSSMGKLSGQFDGGVFYFTLIQTVEGCPGSFSGRLKVEGDSGTGTYVGTDCEGEHKNGVVSMMRLVPDKSTSTTREINASASSDCIVSHEEEDYVTWLCDAQGRLLPDKAEVFFLRTNYWGEPIAMSVWSGPRKQWTDTIPQVISQHREKISKCLVYFNVSYITKNGQIRWNWGPKPFWKWWKKNGSNKFPRFCYTKEPWEADYVAVWSDSQYSVPYSFSIPVPQTSYVTGNMSGWVGGDYVQGNYSGYVYSTQNQTYSGSRSVLAVNAVVYPVRPNTRVVFESKHTGRWRWSKPQKDVLIDSLRFIQKEIPSQE